MADRISALHGHIAKGRFGYAGATGISLTLVGDLQLHQVAAWADSLEVVGQQIAALVGVPEAADPGQSAGDANRAMLRIEPLKWWLVGASPPAFEPHQGACLDLSHSRTRIRISGDNAPTLLNRLLPLDLREANFPQGSVASSVLHHVGVTLWLNERGYELFIPRSYALSVWEVILQTALQFGVEVSKEN